MKLEEVLSEELKEYAAAAQLDWSWYFGEISKFANEEEIKLLFDTGKQICINESKVLFKDFEDDKVSIKKLIYTDYIPLSYTKAYFLESLVFLKNRPDQFNLTQFSENIKRASEEDIAGKMMRGAMKVIIKYHLALNKDKIDADWLNKILTDLEQTNKSITKYILLNSLRLCGQTEIAIEEWIDSGRVFYNSDSLGKAYILKSVEMIEQNKINFREWIKFAKEFNIIDQEIAEKYLKFSNYVLKNGQIDFWDWTKLGLKIAKANKNAGKYFFANSPEYIYDGYMPKIINLIEKCSKPEDYDLLKYQFKLENSKFNEFSTIAYLLNNELSKFKKANHISPNSLKSISALPKGDGFIVDYAMEALKIIDELKLPDTDSTFNEITKRLNGMDLFRKFCGKLLPNKRNAIKRFDFDTGLDILRFTKMYKISPGINSNSFKISSQNACFRDYFVYCIRKCPLFENKKDKEIFESLKKSYNNRIEDYKISQLIRPLIKEITQFRTFNEESDDLLDELAGYFITPKKFNNVQLINATSQNFTHSLEDNVELKSCVFGPNGSVREACLSYLCDPSIDLLFIETYFEEEIMENIGVVYLIDTKENVVIIDGVDGGKTMQRLNLNEAVYKELCRYKHELLRTKGSNLVLNTNIGKNKTTNDFLEYVCIKTGIKYHRESDHIIVDEKDKIKKKLNKPLLSESNPEAYKALGPNGNLSYLDAWCNSCGNIWNTGQGEVEYIELA